MKIPILNIYYLLCYAWNKLEEREIVNVHVDNTMEWAELSARVLINGTTYLFKKGLDRDYRLVEEDYRGIKGKIHFGSTLKRNLLKAAKTRCEYDELTYNVIHNQILKIIIGRLARVKSMPTELKEELILLHKRFPKVDDIKLEGAHFSQVKLHRNNYFYDFLLKICRIVHDSLLMIEKTGKYKFMDFVRNDEMMHGLFEAFVRNFYKKELKGFHVGREYINWALEEKGETYSYLPRMETDVSITTPDGTNKIVVETKYYSSGFKTPSRFGFQDKLISEDLYQLFAYLKNLEETGGTNSNCDGVLLYATVKEDADLSFALPRHNVRVKTLNLNKDWKDIHRDLLAIAIRDSHRDTRTVA